MKKPKLNKLKAFGIILLLIIAISFTTLSIVFNTIGIIFDDTNMILEGCIIFISAIGLSIIAFTFYLDIKIDRLR